MNVHQLIDAIHSRVPARGKPYERTRPSKRAIEDVLTAAGSVIVETVPLELVYFPGLGTFRLKKRKGMRVVSPKGTHHEIHERWELKFRALPKLRKIE